MDVPSKEAMAEGENERSEVFRPLGGRRSLADALIDRLTAEITSGRLVPGSRLPTEREMMASMGISRTVVREAIAALRAEGLISTRQGLGAFVADDVDGRPFRLQTGRARSLRMAIEVMELRMGVEVEAAGLAAGRADASDLERIEAAFAAIDDAVARGDTAVEQDFAFHAAVASATGNPQFHRFIGYLGHFIIPRMSVRYAGSEDELQRGYLGKIQQEHREIADAIRNHDEEEAQAAMRRHLGGSLERYRRLATPDNEETNADDL